MVDNWDQTQATFGTPADSPIPSVAPPTITTTTATPNISSAAGLSFFVGNQLASQIIAADSNRHDVIITNQGISMVFLSGIPGALAPNGYCLHAGESVKTNSSEALWAVTMVGRCRIDVMEFAR